MLLRRVLQRKDDGSIIVVAAIITPIVLLCIALALATLVWAGSENETQHASDEAALETASSALLLDLYEPLSAVSGVLSYPSLGNKTSTRPLPTIDACQTVGNPFGAVDGLFDDEDVIGEGGYVVESALDALLNLLKTLTLGLLGSVDQTAKNLGNDLDALRTAKPALFNATETLAQSCSDALSGVTGVLPDPPAQAPGSRGQACGVAEREMTDAGYSRSFYAPSDGNDLPTCDNGRVRVGFGTSSPLVGFTDSAIDVNGDLTLSVPLGYNDVRNRLAAYGVRLESLLPNALCPQVDVEVDQPVREPVFDRSTLPNGRASARRVVKNAVVVPVFNGLGIKSTTQPIDDIISQGTGSSLLAGGSVGGSITTPAYNLNPTLFEVREDILGLLDQAELALNNDTVVSDTGVQQLNGTLDAVEATTGLPMPSTSATLGDLNLLQCLKSTVRQIFDPTAENPPTVQEIFDEAAASGDPVHLIQIGARSCNTANSPADALSCVQYAAGTTSVDSVQNITKIYDVPFLDITPVILKDLQDGNYLAVPLHATQAAGAFRASLIRSTTDTRYVASGRLP